MGSYSSCVDYKLIKKSSDSLYNFSSWAGVCYGESGVSVLGSVRQSLSNIGLEHDDCFNECLKPIEDIEKKTAEITKEIGHLSECLGDTEKAFKKAEDDIENSTTRETGLLSFLGKLDSIYGIDKEESLTKEIDAGKDISFNRDNFKNHITDETKKEIEDKIKAANAEISSKAESDILEDNMLTKTGALILSSFSSLLGNPLALELKNIDKEIAFAPYSEKGRKQEMISRLKKKYPGLSDSQIEQAVDSYLESKETTSTKNGSGGNDGSDYQYRKASGNENNNTVTKSGDSNNKVDSKPDSGGDNSNAGNKPNNGGDNSTTGNKPDNGGDSSNTNNKPNNGDNNNNVDNKPSNGDNNSNTDNKPNNGDNNNNIDNKPTDGGNNNSTVTPPSNNNSGGSSNTGQGNGSYNPGNSGNSNGNYRPGNGNYVNNGGNNTSNITPTPGGGENNNVSTTTPSAPDSSSGIIDNSGEGLDVISIDKNPSGKAPSTSSNDGGSVIPTILGVGVAGAAAVAGAKYIKDKKDKSNNYDDDYSTDEKDNSFSYMSNYQENNSDNNGNYDSYTSNDDSYSNIIEPSTKYKAGNVNALVLDETPEEIKITDDIPAGEQKEELE